MPPLRVGTDYSGIEAPIVTLRALHQPVSHEFSSEICPHATKVIKALFKPKVLFANALKQRTLPSKLDIYVAGFPCPIFSQINSLTGNHADARNPLVHFKNCLSVVKACKPKVFILENVKNIKHTQGGKIWKKLHQSVRNVCESHYHLVTHKMNTKDYGAPQNRERMYIIGLRNDIARKPLSCPKTKPLKIKFEDIMEKRAQRRAISPKMQQRYDKCSKQIPLSSFMPVSILRMKCCGSPLPPCLTRRGEGIYWSKRNILTTVREELRLQGFPDTFKFPEGMSGTVCRQLIGNSMSVNVLKALFKQIFKETKLRKARSRSQ